MFSTFVFAWHLILNANVVIRNLFFFFFCFFFCFFCFCFFCFFFVFFSVSVVLYFQIFAVKFILHPKQMVLVYAISIVNGNFIIFIRKYCFLF